MKDTCLFARKKKPTTEEESGVLKNARDDLYIQSLFYVAV